MTWNHTGGSAEAVIEGVEHIPLFTGTVYYVDASAGSDDNAGTSPDTAFETIGKAISSMSTGDATTIKAGTYAETGLDLNVAACELWFEIGAILAPASGTPLTISANYCKVECPGGSLRVNPAANQTGVIVSGGFCYVHDIRVPAGSSADIGFDITGNGNVLTNCRCSDPLVAAFKVQGDKTKLEDCCTGGTIANVSIGFWAMNSCDKTRIDNCGSQGHSTAGYQVDAGCTNTVVRNSSTGGGDGRRIDNGTDTVFANFQPDEHERKFGGRVWYVDGTNGADTADGLQPGTAFATIGAAITASAAGDAINIKAATYDENGLDVANDSTELWCEIGTFISNTNPGTCLTVSGDNCRIEGLRVTQAGQVGVNVTGQGCVLESVIVVLCSVGFDIDGQSTLMIDCVSGSCTTTGFDIAAQNCIMRSCYATGTGAATRGFYLSNAAADRCLIDRCSSVGNATAGYEMVAGCSNNSVTYCSSGAGDGSRVDPNLTNMWASFADQLPDEHHEHIYPYCLGQGVANDPVTISNSTTDGGGGTRDDQNYWGDVATIIPVSTLTSVWTSVGIYIHATTGVDVQQWEIFYPRTTYSSAQNSGNDWDENETALTVADGSIFEDGDFVWITGNDRTAGEILKVSGAPAGNVVTIARETTADGEAGLRYDYDTDDSANAMYVASRPGVASLHRIEGDHSAANARQFTPYRWHEAREIPANTGMIMRMLNATDNGTSTFDVRAIYED